MGDEDHGYVIITVFVFGALAIILLVAAVFVFYYAGNPPFVRQINVTNAGTEPVNVLVGGILSNGKVLFLPSRRLEQGQTHRYQATPGIHVLIQGYDDGTIISITGNNPFTTAHLLLSGINFSSKTELTDGEAVINDLLHNEEQFSSDLYGVSVLDGYNLPVFVQTNTILGGSLCGGPRWNNTINKDAPNMCPVELQSPNHENYTSCLPPCKVFGTEVYCCTGLGACEATGGCQSGWPNKDYYKVFADACPQCIITNCDRLNFTCDSQGGTSVFTITFGKTLPSS